MDFKSHDRLCSEAGERAIKLNFMQEIDYTNVRYVQLMQLENDKMVSEIYHGDDGLFISYRYGVVQRKEKEGDEMRYGYDKKAMTMPRAFRGSWENISTACTSAVGIVRRQTVSGHQRCSSNR